MTPWSRDRTATRASTSFSRILGYISDGYKKPTLSGHFWWAELSTEGGSLHSTAPDPQRAGAETHSSTDGDTGLRAPCTVTRPIQVRKRTVQQCQSYEVHRPSEMALREAWELNTELLSSHLISELEMNVEKQLHLVAH